MRAMQPFGVLVCTGVAGLVFLGGCGGHASTKRVQQSAGTNPPPIYVLESPQAEPTGRFGQQIAVAGSTIVVGAPAESGAAAGAGRVHVFAFDTGQVTRSTNSPNAEVDGAFGSQLAFVGAHLVVAAGNEDVGGLDAAGRLYLIDPATWQLERTITSPNAQTKGWFGGRAKYQPVVGEVSGLLFASAAGEAVAGANMAGRVYLFDPATGALVRTLESPLPEALGFFGNAVVASAGRLVIGASRESVNGLNAGRVHVFEPGTGALLLTLTSPSPQHNGLFGNALAADANRILVGAPLEGGDGRAYLFERASGKLLHTFASPAGESDGRFGGALALQNDDVFIAAYGEDAGAPNAGRVYRFEALSGALLETIESPAPEADGAFGRALRTTDRALVIGAMGEARGAGRVYVNP